MRKVNKRSAGYKQGFHAGLYPAKPQKDMQGIWSYSEPQLVSRTSGPALAAAQRLFDIGYRDGVERREQIENAAYRLIRHLDWRPTAANSEAAVMCSGCSAHISVNESIHANHMHVCGDECAQKVEWRIAKHAAAKACQL